MLSSTREGPAGAAARARLGWIVLFVILVATAGSRIVVAAGAPERTLTNQDSPSYLDPAAALEQVGRFDTTPTSDVPMFFRTPGYPAFLAVLGTVVGNSVRELAIGQAILSTLIVLGAFVLARQWWGGWSIPLLAAAAVAFEPLQVGSSANIATESLTSGMYVAVAIAATSAARRGSAWRWAGTGLLLALATFVRPSTYYLPLALAIVLVLGLRFWDWWPGWRRSLVWGLALLLPCVVCFGAWQVRNHRAVNSWRFSGVEPVYLYMYNAAAVTARETGRPYSAIRKEFRTDFNAAHGFEGQGPYLDAMFDEGRKILLRHPFTSARVSLAGETSLLFGVKIDLYPKLRLDPSTWRNTLARIGLILFYIVTLFGIVRTLWSIRHNDVGPAHVVVLLLVGSVLLVSAGPASTPRFRVPVTPLLCLYFAYGLVTIAQHVRTMTTRAAPPDLPASSNASPPIPVENVQ